MYTEGIAWKAKLVLTLLWLNFVVLWIRVYTITRASDVTDSINYITGIISAYGLLVTIWIFHNIRIHKKKGPRRSVRAVSDNRTHDALQNYIAYKSDLKRTQEIVINVIDGRKIFAEGAGSQNEQEQEPGLVGTL